MHRISDDEYRVAIDGDRSVALHWDTERIAYVGTCPVCGGRAEKHAYDDGDGMWDECLECRDCDWTYWIV